MLWGVFVWLKWNYGWYKLGRLNTPQLAFWFHICLEVDIERNKITVAMNERLLGAVLGNSIPSTVRLGVVGDYGTWFIDVGLDSTSYIEDVSNSSCKNIGTC